MPSSWKGNKAWFTGINGCLQTLTKIDLNRMPLISFIL